MSLFAQTGAAEAITSGIDEVTIVRVEDGRTRPLPIGRGPSTLVEAAPDGSLYLAIDRSGQGVMVRLFDRDGSVVGEWSPEAPATPEASPFPRSSVVPAGDRIAWQQDSARVVVSIVGVGVFVADPELTMTQVQAGSTRAVTAVAWSPTGQSIALATWNNDHRSAEILTVGLDSLDSAGTSVFALPEGDGRYVRSLGWGSERVGLIFALRAAGSNFSLPNDLYFLPRFGEPMRLLATAGVAAPAAVVDQLAIAGNGTTVAFSVLIPGEAGLRFHSIWVTDALAPAPVRADTAGIRRLLEMEWTPDGLVVSGTGRAQEAGASYQIAVVAQISSSGAKEISSDRSVATPVASPQASPVAATPVASPVSPSAG